MLVVMIGSFTRSPRLAHSFCCWRMTRCCTFLRAGATLYSTLEILLLWLGKHLSTPRRCFATCKM